MSLYTLHTLATGGQIVAAPTLASAEETRLAVVDSSLAARRTH